MTGHIVLILNCHSVTVCIHLFKNLKKNFNAECFSKQFDSQVTTNKIIYIEWIRKHNAIEKEVISCTKLKLKM